jgi:hypothetical protein
MPGRAAGTAQLAPAGLQATGTDIDGVLGRKRLHPFAPWHDNTPGGLGQLRSRGIELAQRGNVGGVEEGGGFFARWSVGRAEMMYPSVVALVS